MWYGGAFASSAPAVSAAGYYTTNFSGTENPLSEGGVWTCGLAAGLDWTNPRKTPGLCFGTQTPKSPPPFDDSLACLSGFGANQYATAVLHNASAANGIELELLLRWQITAHGSRGYEIDIVRGGNLNIVRWNGTLNDFTVLVPNVNTNTSTANGAVWYAEIVGHIITVKCNGLTCTTYDTTSDSPRWDSGNPGLGFYRDTLNGAPSAADTFAWSSFTASNL